MKRARLPLLLRGAVLRASIRPLAAAVYLLPVCAPAQPLPEPLTLEYALSLADDGHPDLRAASADLAQAQARQLQVEARNDLRIDLEGRLRIIEPSSLARDQSQQDSRLQLVLRKPLYDFGRTRHARDSAAAQTKSREWSYLDTRQRRRIAILTRYFDVLLADLEYIRDNEAMAIAFVHFDRAQNHAELGAISDIALFEARSDYQAARRQRFASERRQRAARARLALALNRPGELSSQLARPPPADQGRPLPELDELNAAALRRNPVLLALRGQAAAQRAALQANLAAHGPLLSGEAQAAAYSRRADSSDDWRLGILLEIPLYTGRRIAAEGAGGRARLQSLQAQLAGEEMQVRQAALELWLELQNLATEREQLQALEEFRDLDLDRSRALYELELEADLGDAMARISDYRLRQAQNEFRTALAWARLDAMRGKTIGGEGD